MVLIITPKNKASLNQQVARFVHHQVKKKKRILFIDCSRSVNELFLETANLEAILHYLQVIKPMRFNQLISSLEKFVTFKEFLVCDIIMVVGASTLFEGEIDFPTTSINMILKRIEEKYDKMTVVMDKEWNSQFQLVRK
ncbi:MAG: hypothetical protein QF632_06710 [Candidatus Woesearchaeota archaeon]|jgi:hypothetical protein|nr:hypothetical protein [Candidatus Woesearchaeota archaeon]MDP7458568.1 hypothetical protein [Candidatus Woesearchaeota archaeon]|tara:strand:- start:3 stop:419 length:417 start_codon:yes stop_codon:yes gene_type:complete